MTEDLAQDPDVEPYPHSRTRSSNCEATDLQEGGNASPEHSIGNQAGEYYQDVDNSSQISEAEGGTTSEPLCTELIDPEPNPNTPLKFKVLLTECEWRGYA